LPTEKECFRFVEPEAIKKIHRGCRAEVGRLIAKKYRVGNNFLPRHMTLLALFAAVEKFSSENNIAGGYAFIKNSLKKKLEKLMFPFHEIKPNEEIYGQGVLKPYFDQKKNPVIPIYFLASEIRQYFIGMTRFKLLLVRINENEYRFKKTSILKILLWKFFHILDRI